jgi:hypothetical protein
VKPGDLVRLNNQGNPVRIAPFPNRNEPWAKHTYPPGTLAVVVEVSEVGADGPGMETWALVMVGEVLSYVWLYECEEIKHETR